MTCWGRDVGIGAFFDWLGENHADQFRRLADRGELRRDIEPKDAAGAVVSMLDGLVSHLALFQPASDAFADRRDAAISLLDARLRP